MRRLLPILFALAFACYPSASGLTTLVVAVRNGDSPQIRALVARGADPNATDAGLNHWTPLLHAVHKHQLGSAEALLASGADPNRGSPSGFTPLMMAAGYGDTRMIELLLRHGASTTLTSERGETPLDLALTGVGDIDDFTLFRCQDEAASMLLRANPSLLARNAPSAIAARRWVRLKRCTVGG